MLKRTLLQSLHMEKNNKYQIRIHAWAMNILFWLSVHSLFSHIRYTSLLQSSAPVSWLDNWLILSPWVLNWIWVTALVFSFTTKHYNQPHSLFKHVGLHLLLGINCIFLYWLSCVVLRTVMQGESLSYFLSRLSTVMDSTLHLDLSIYLGILVFWYFGILVSAFATNFYHNSIMEKLAFKKLQHDFDKEKLKTLRAQLNPHFLFNALNTVVSLIRLERSQQAITATTELSQMLRTILQNKGEDTVKVKEEIAFIQSYLAIQKMRFEDGLFETRLAIPLGG